MTDAESEIYNTQTHREKVARAMYGCHPNDVPWDEQGKLIRDFWLKSARYALAAHVGKTVAFDGMIR